MHAKYAGSSGEMVSLMAKGGGGQYDMVSASGDADLRLIYGGDVKPVNVSLVKDWQQFRPFLKAPNFNTIGGIHYGTSLQFGPNVLLYSTKTFPTAPTSWSVIYDPKYKGQITVPNNPIQIADAALYLEKTKASLGITDPYELTRPQFTAAVALLKAQKPLIASTGTWPATRSTCSRAARPSWAQPGRTRRSPCRGTRPRWPTRCRPRARQAGPTRG